MERTRKKARDNLYKFEKTIDRMLIEVNK